jgi:outer membrane biosynthesis protein TonB
VVSIAAHVVALGTLALVPGLLPKRAAPPAVVMTISLGGTPGPKTGGMTMLGGRAIQAAAPSVAPKVERVAMPTPKAEPAMVMPVPDPKMKAKTPKTPLASKDPQGHAVGRGFETQKGSTAVETGARGMGFGLSSSGGGGSGGHLDVKDFCCPEYLTDMLDRVRSNWVQQQDAVGTVMMKFTILRNGQIAAIETEQPSNFFSLNQASLRALTLTGKLQPLPAPFPDDHLVVHLNFEYQRR